VELATRVMSKLASAFTFAPVREVDLDLVRGWLLQPHVRQWFDDVATAAYPEDTISEYRSAIRGDDPTDLHIIALRGRPIGVLQSYRIDDHPDYAAQLALPQSAVGIDLFIGEPDSVGRGHGPTLIRDFLRDVAFPKYGVELCVIGPTVSNTAAIRAYETAGFRFLKTYLEPESREQEHYLMELRRADLDAATL
jgi:aminoglycoside 6'-N-acetyltransferase